MRDRRPRDEVAVAVACWRVWEWCGGSAGCGELSLEDLTEPADEADLIDVRPGESGSGRVLEVRELAGVAEVPLDDTGKEDVEEDVWRAAGGGCELVMMK